MKDDKQKNLHPHDADTGSAADVEAVMKKFDRESNVRVWTGKPKFAVSLILAGFSVFCIYVTLFANMLEQARMMSFIGLVLIMGYLIYPIRKTHVRENTRESYDVGRGNGHVES